jgi:Tfp pilus assembly protein PilO
MVTLLLIAGSAYAYIRFVQQSQIEDLSLELESLNTDYLAKVEISEDYPPLLSRYNMARGIILNYDKQLYKVNNPDDVYDYLSEINDENLELYYDFAFQDSVVEERYGILNSRINGAAIYSDFVTFINKLENSSLLNKVSQVSIRPASDFETNDYIDFSLQLNSYYQKENLETQKASVDRFRFDPTISVFNPLKPLILQNVPGNVDELVNVGSSRIIGLTSRRVFLIDQTGKTQILKPGDKVYLGYLQEINIKDREVIFNLDKGGIKELFTLEVER